MLVPPWRVTGLMVLAGLLAGGTAHALLRLNQGRDQVFVNVGASMTYDSNIYTAAGGQGDTIYTGSLSIDYERRAGLISVTGNVGFDVGRFDEFKTENFLNPSYRVELAKDSGRTTGSLTASARRDVRADPDANLRTDSWNYETALNFKYPVIERYSLTGSFGYGLRDYADNTVLVDLETFMFSAEVFYVYTTERDLIGGYRMRVSETSAETTYHDHSFTVGVSGKILAKLNGTVRVGYQFREGRGPGTVDNQGLTMAASTTWSLNRRATLTGQMSRDFSVTSTNASVNSLQGAIDARYTFNNRLTGFVTVGGGENRFSSDLTGDRVDTFFSSSVGMAATITSYLRGDLSYTFYRNWSSLALGDFTRESYTLNLRARF
jgi:hypothetical protein